jgi:hypothetical protein
VSTESWVVVGSVTGIVLVIIGVVTIGLMIRFRPKNEPPKSEPAKPVLYNIKDCLIDIGNSFPGPFFREKVWFKFSIDNEGGEKCSVIGVDLILPNGLPAKLDDKISTPPLPKTIEIHEPVEFSMYGFCSEPQKLPNVVKERTSGISAEQKFVETTIIIKFKNAGEIKEFKSFPVKYRPSHT